MGESGTRKNAVLVGAFNAWPGSLEQSYRRALEALGWGVSVFDAPSALGAATRGGRLGRMLLERVDVPVWLADAFRGLVCVVADRAPQLLLVFGQIRITAGVLAQCVAASPKTRLVLVWPDTLVNLHPHVVAALPLYDLVASYSRAACEPMARLGARAVRWVPLGGDPELHAGAAAADLPAMRCDVSFVGNWRPEREESLNAILGVPGVTVEIWGGADWKRRTRRGSLCRGVWKGRAAYGAEFAQITRASRLSLNVIDDTNYPAANMRFFEILTAGGVQLCSPCPEMEEEFVDGETIFYYKDVASLCERLRRLLAEDEKRADVRERAARLLRERHTYRHRAALILSEAGL